MSRSGAFRRIWCVPLFMAIASVAAAEPPPTVTPEQEFIAEQQALLAEELKQAPLLPARPLAEIVRLRFTNGSLAFELLAKDVEDTGIIPLAGVNGVCQIQRFGAVPFEQDAMRISVHCLDASKNKATTIMLSSVGGRVNLDVTLQTPQQSTMTQLILGRATPFDTEEVDAKLYIQSSSENEAAAIPALQRSAENAAKLFAENHTAILTAVGDGFRLLRAVHLLSGMNEREVRHMLAANVDVSADVTRDIKLAIDSMRSEPDVGEKRLRKLLESAGPSAVAAMTHISREGWTADQTLRVDTILSRFVPEDPHELDIVRTQPSRLVDMLYWPDVGIRKAVLEQLQVASGSTFRVDPGVDPYTQSDAIEAIREQLKAKR